MTKKELKAEMTRCNISWEGSNYPEMKRWWDSTLNGTERDGYGIAEVFARLGWVYRSEGKWRRI